MKEIQNMIDVVAYDKRLDKGLVKSILCQSILKFNPEIEPTVAEDDIFNKFNPSRVNLQMLKQEFHKNLKEAEIKHIIAQYKGSLNQLFKGKVVEIRKNWAFVEINQTLIGKIDLAKEKTRVKLGQYYAGVLSHFDEKAVTPLVLTQKSDYFIKELFKKEIPEIEDGLVEVVKVSRLPQKLSRVIVKGHSRIDPIRSCLGAKNSRLQSILDQLEGERIELIKWADNLPELTINALSFAKVEGLVIDEEEKEITALVEGEQLAFCQAKKLQLDLTEDLLGFDIYFKDKAIYEQNKQEENQKLLELLVTALDVDAEVASVLMEHNFSSIEEVAFSPDLNDVEEFDEEIVASLKQRANEYLKNNH